MGEDQEKRYQQARALSHHRRSLIFVLKERMDGLLHVSYAFFRLIFELWLYRTIYNLSTLKQENVQHTLYQRYSDTINKYLTANVLPDLTKLAQESSSSNEEELLQKL